jgi:hypothetical protein
MDYIYVVFNSKSVLNLQKLVQARKAYYSNKSL